MTILTALFVKTQMNSILALFCYYLGLFEFLIIVSLQLHKRTKDVLVLVSILITEQHMLGFFIHTGLLQVL